MKTEQKKLPKSQIEISFELTAEEFDQHFEHALGHLKQHVKVEGFRPGHATAKIVEDRIKPEVLLMEAGDHAVQHVYLDHIKQSGLEPVGHPDVKIKKIAKGNPFVFTATITVFPEVELPDYKEIAKSVKSKDTAVTDEEIEDAIKYLQKSRAKLTLKNDIAQKGDFVEIEYKNKDINAGKPINDKFILGEAGFIKGFEENISGMKAGEEKVFILKEKGEFKVSMKSVQNVELAVFENLEELKKSIRESILAEKTEAEKQRRRGEILEKIAEKSKLEVPETMVKYEQERLFEDLKNKISQITKATFKEYLSAIKQTEEQIKQTYQKEAEKRVKNYLVLREIGKKESVDTSKETEYTESIFKILENY